MLFKNPLFTIIIPTLNRADTLLWSLRTVVEQEYGNLKIIVSDNCSDDNTADVVKRYDDPRLSYIKTPERFTMLQHFEYALNYVKEGYISFIGDDDGFLPNSLFKVCNIINKHKPIAVGWRFGNYNWPALPGFFMIPMGNYYRIVNSKKEIENVFAGNIYDAIRFPSLYGGFVSIDFVNELKNKYGGYFFHSRIPDFFSGAFIAANLTEYIRLEFPVTINATSAKSAGFATVSTKVDQKPFENLLSENGNIPFHPSLKFIRCNVVPVAEALLRVSELIPGYPKVDAKKVIRQVISELAVEADDAKFNELYQGIIEIGKLNNLENFTKNELSKMNRRPIPHNVKDKFSPVSLLLYVNAEKAGVTNVYQATHYTERIISKKYFLLKYSFQKTIVRGVQFMRYLGLKFFSSKIYGKKI